MHICRSVLCACTPAPAAVPPSEEQQEEEDRQPSFAQKFLLGSGSTLALAILCSKMTVPIKLPVAVALTPYVHRWGVGARGCCCNVVVVVVLGCPKPMGPSCKHVLFLRFLLCHRYSTGSCSCMRVYASIHLLVRARVTSAGRACCRLVRPGLRDNGTKRSPSAPTQCAVCHVCRVWSGALSLGTIYGMAC